MEKVTRDPVNNLNDIRNDGLIFTGLFIPKSQSKEWEPKLVQMLNLSYQVMFRCQNNIIVCQPCARYFTFVAFLNPKNNLKILFWYFKWGLETGVINKVFYMRVCLCAQLHSNFLTPRTSLPIRLPRPWNFPTHWSRLPFPTSGDFRDP